MPLIVALRALHVWPDATLLALAVLLPVSLAVANASWHVLERPAIRAARRIEPTARPRTATAPAT
jgi:peptidoglycan/LPS O-acetylase OafA/YrhL